MTTSIAAVAHISHGKTYFSTAKLYKSKFFRVKAAFAVEKKLLSWKRKYCIGK